LAYARVIPDPAEAPEGIFKDVYDLATAAGPTTAIAAASFAAYLVGALSVEATATVLPMLRVRPRRGVIGDAFRLGVATPSAAGFDALREAVLDELEPRYDQDARLANLLAEAHDKCGESRDLGDRAVRRGLIDVRIDVDYYARLIQRDLPMVPLRLLAKGKKDEIYGEFDRLRAEAEFRASVAPPLAAVVAVVAWRTSPWWLFALAAPVLLVLVAAHNVTAAADVLAESIRARAAESPVLAQLQAGRLQLREDWIKRAAKDYAGAMTLLAAELEKAGDPRAEKWYREAAKNGDPPAMFWLAGRLHLSGEPEADEWYAKAAAAGEPDAQKIADLKDELAPAEVTDLKAAYAGDPAAMTRVGKRLEDNEEMDEAEYWYGKAGEACYGPARAAMAALLRSRGKNAAASYWDQDCDGTSGRTDVDHDTVRAAS
jgi:hypothetical protein